MYQRHAICEAWREVADAIPDPQIQQVLADFERPSDDCWYGLMDRLRVLDPLRLNLIRNLDSSKPDELDLLTRFVKQARPHADHIELQALTMTTSPDIVKRVGRKKGLSPDLRALVLMERERLD